MTETLTDGRTYIEPQDALDELRLLESAGDPEIAHGRADAILQELILYVTYIGDLDDWPEGVDEILAAYERIRKWYA